MIDDRQLLRLSRNLATAMIVLVGTYLAVTGLAYSMWTIVSIFDAFPGTDSWASALQSAIYLVSGVALILRRNWLAHKLIKPVRTDTCPACDYPIESANKHCPECGLAITPPETPS